MQRERSILLLGGGGHALVVAETLLRAHQRIDGFYDDNPDAPLAHEPGAIEYLGTLATAAPRQDADVLLAIGSLASRASLLNDLSNLATTSAQAIDPDASVALSASLGRGLFIGPRAIVQARAHIADHAIINSGAIVEHECEIGLNTHIAPGAVLGGRVRVGPHTLVGLGARVLPGLTIGTGVTVAAGAVVTRDIPDHQCVVGVPARTR